MRLIIGLISFWVSTIGYVLYTNKKTKLPYELALPLVFTIIAIVVFLSGILNMMKLACLAICLVGIILFAKSIISKEIGLKKINKKNLIVFIIVFIYLTVLCEKLHITHYDNFSHWGLIVKTMFAKNHLPNFEDTIISFKNYQPGSACFIYYVGLLLGKTEGSMIIGQNYLLASYALSLLVFAREKEKNNKNSSMVRLVVLLFYIFISIGNHKYNFPALNDLLVDALLSAISIYSIVIMYYYRNDLKKVFTYILPVSVYLFLVKNTGIVLVFFNCLGLLYLGYKNKNIKKGFIYAFIVGISSLFFFYIWSRHVAYVFGITGLDSKHSLSASNIIGELQDKGTKGVLEFCSIYLKHFLNVFHNIPHLFMISMNIIALMIAYIYKDKKKIIIKCLIVNDLIYLFYYFILGVMYLLSMPWAEAIVLASFDRYMLTMVFINIGCFIICCLDIFTKDKSRKSIPCLLILVISLIALIMININNSYSNVLIGKLNYNKTNIYKIRSIADDNKKYLDNRYYYYVYKNHDKDSDDFIIHVCRFILNTNKITVIDNKDLSIIDQNEDLENIIIVMDKSKDIESYLKDHEYTKKSNNLYIE